MEECLFYYDSIADAIEPHSSRVVFFTFLPTGKVGINGIIYWWFYSIFAFLQLVNELLENLSVDTFNVVISSKHFQELSKDEYEPWFKTQYSIKGYISFVDLFYKIPQANYTLKLDDTETKKKRPNGTIPNYAAAYRLPGLSIFLLRKFLFQ